jgi:hypothetical protein
MNLDWLNLIIGGLIGALLTPLPSALLAVFRALTKATTPFDITGDWFSAEYELKTADPAKRNTIIKARLRKSITGRITVKSIQQISTANPRRPTAWLVQGTLHGNVLVGDWVSTVPGSNRFGTILLAFYDEGRAIGYYLAYNANDGPICGYWLMSRDEQDLCELSEGVMRQFKLNRIKAIVENCDPRIKRTGP